MLEACAINSSPDSAITQILQSIEDASAEQQQSQPILQQCVPDDDEGGVSNALSHGNSKSLAANISSEHP